MKHVRAVETLDPVTIVDGDGDVRTIHDVTVDGPPMPNHHRIALRGRRRDIDAEEAELYASVNPEVVPKVVGLYMDLGLRARRLTHLMNELSHASMLTGLIANQGSDREELIEKYGGAPGEQGVKNLQYRIASIQNRAIDNMWNGLGFAQIYGSQRDENGNLNHEFIGLNHHARKNFVGQSNQKNRETLRNRLEVYREK